MRSSRGCRYGCRDVLRALLALTTVLVGSTEAGSTLLRRDPSGVGLFLPGNVWISGDVTLGFDAPESGPVSGEIDDLSLLARWEPLDRLAFFGELRVEDPLEVVEGQGVDTAQRDVILERLYAEIILTPQLSLRAGKQYTPFGRWNVITRAPLTWTIEEPAITENVFPQRATGLSLTYQGIWRGWGVDATTYGPAQNDLQFRHSEDGGMRAGLLFGGRLAAGREVGSAFVSLGVNAAGFRSHDNSRPWAVATGGDLEVDVAGHEITSELTYRVPTRGGRMENGLYVQDAIPLLGPLYGVLRFEYLRARHGPDAFGQLVGLFYRPVPNVILKADYMFADHDAEGLEVGFHASVSLLF